MLSLRQRPNVQLVGVSDQDYWDIQDMLDEARGHFDKNVQVRNMLSAAHSASKGRYVNLVEEGWHQLETYRGRKWLHVTLFYNGVKYHCYSAVTDLTDVPEPGTHTIETISYVSFVARKSKLLEVWRA